MRVLSIHEDLPKGLYFFYLDYNDGHITLAVTSEPIVAHADEDGYNTTRLTDNFVGMMTLKSIIKYVSNYCANHYGAHIFFHPKTEVEFYVMEIDNQLKKGN